MSGFVQFSYVIISAGRDSGYEEGEKRGESRHVCLLINRFVKCLAMFLQNKCECQSGSEAKKSDRARSRSHSHSFLLTHLGSNQDSAEPKSDVLPITPWVNINQGDAAKL